MASGRFIDRERAEKETERFRHYLEKHHVTDSLTKALAKMKNEPVWPTHPMDFLIQELRRSVPMTIYQPAEQQAMADLLRRNTELEKAVANYQKLCMTTAMEAILPDSPSSSNGS